MATLELSACERAIFCPLGNAVLTAIQGLVGVQVAALSAQLAAVTATLLSLQIQLVPLKLTAAAAQLVLDQAESVVNLIPSAALNGCLDAGLSMRAFSDSLASARADVKRTLEAANRSISYEAFLLDKQATLQVAIDDLAAFRSRLATC